MTVLLIASALGSVALAWLCATGLGRLTGWRPAVRWLVAGLVLLVAGVVSGLQLSSWLSNEDCYEICDTPAWRGLLAGWTAAAVQLPVIVLAGVALLVQLARRRRA